MSSLYRLISVMGFIPRARISIPRKKLTPCQRRCLSTLEQQQTSKSLNVKGNIFHPSPNASQSGQGFANNNDKLNINNNWKVVDVPVVLAPGMKGTHLAVSDAQRRAAQLELDRMNESTSRLLQMTTVPMSEAIVNEARVALHYWSRRWYMHFHPGFGRAARGSQLSLKALRQWDINTLDNMNKTLAGLDSIPARTNSQEQQQECGDHGARQAERLLDWSIANGLIPHGIFNLSDEISYIKTDDKNLATSPNLTCANIVQTYLLPCEFGGFGSGIYQQHTHGESNGITNDATLSKHFIANASYVRALADASRVMNKMKKLHSTYPDQISPDTLSIITEMNVWSKRAILLNEILTNENVAASNVGLNGNSHIELLQALDDDGDFGGNIENDKKYTLQGCLDHMETILAEAENRYVSTNDDRIRPSVDWYNHIIGAWARSDLNNALEKTKQFVHGMEQCGKTEEDVDSNTENNFRRCWAKPNTITYNGLLFCLARDHGKGCAKAAQELLESMNDRYQQKNDEIIRPDEVTYGTVLNALAQAGMAREAEKILDSLEDDYNAFMDQSEANQQDLGSDSVIVPSLTIYNSVLNAWANSCQRNAAERSESLLHRMKVLNRTGRNPNVEPDMISLSTVMKCHAQSVSKEGTLRAEELLDQAIAMYQQGHSKFKPDSIMFNCALLGWASISGVEGHDQGGMAAERAESLLRKMKRLRGDSSTDIHQHTQSYNIVLDCWAKSMHPSAATRALALMREMLSPDECSYNSVLHAMTKHTGTEMVSSAEDLFEEMKDLKTKKQLSISEITFHVMMNVYGKSRDFNGAKRAEELLRSMQSNELTPNSTSYNICIDAYARRADPIRATSLLDEMVALSEHNSECRPTIHSFAAVVNALAKSEVDDAVEQAQKIVRTVEELDYVSPNSVLYNSLIDCITKRSSRDAPSQAEDVLAKMQQMHNDGHSDVRPTSYTYSMVLTCCARSQDDGAAKRADRILMNMEQMYADGLSDVIANDRCYSAVITAWARSGSHNAVQRSFELLYRMEQNLKTGKPHGRPNAHCYNACIHSIAKSSLSGSGKAQKCQEILQRMISQKEKGFVESSPSLITYSTILNACAYAHGSQHDKKEAFNLAKSCFQTLIESEDMKPCTSCYSNFFHVIRLLKPGAVRDLLTEAAFKEASESGKIDEQVLHNVRKLLPPEVARKLLSDRT